MNNEKLKNCNELFFNELGFVDEIICSQNYFAYTSEQKKNWKLLVNRQNEICEKFASHEIKKGINSLGINSENISEISVLSERIDQETSWKLIPIKGLLSEELYFKLLSVKSFPISIEIRTKEEIEFSGKPDLFHDVYGHIPILFNSNIREFLHEFGKIALNYLNDEKVLDYLIKIYWFTMETGLIKENDCMRVFGASALTSSNELENIYYNNNIKIHDFDLNKIMNSHYNITSLQEEYYVLDSFEQLKGINKKLEFLLKNKN